MSIYYFEHLVPIEILMTEPNLTPQEWMLNWSNTSSIINEFKPTKPVLGHKGIRVVGSNQIGTQINRFMATSIAGELVLFIDDGVSVQAKSKGMGIALQQLLTR